VTLTEHQLQVLVFRWAALAMRAYPDLRWMFAVPNAGKRTPQQGRWMKAEGLRAGVPDVWLPVPRGGAPGLVIEHKIGRKQLTDEQAQWAVGLDRLGWRVVVSRSFEDSRLAIVNYLEGR
jgi:hypothetical protein